MDLILWRHAQAEPLLAGADDLERALTAKGQDQAAKVARCLDGCLPPDARILCSPALRAEQTAFALGRRYAVRAELAPTTELQAVLGLIGWDQPKSARSKRSLLLVGHQPWLGQLLTMALQMRQPHCAVPKASFWWLRQRVRQERVQTVLLAAVTPRLLS